MTGFFLRESNAIDSSWKSLLILLMAICIQNQSCIVDHKEIVDPAELKIFALLSFTEKVC